MIGKIMKLSNDNDIKKTIIIEQNIDFKKESSIKNNFFSRLKNSLLKTTQNLKLSFINFLRGKQINEDLFIELEEQMLISDFGIHLTNKIINKLKEQVYSKKLHISENIHSILKTELLKILINVNIPLDVSKKTPFIILMVGVNGVGKTTTVGKMAYQYQMQGYSVMLAAGDTFRAAGIEQLQSWGAYNNIPVISQHTGADTASVIFDAIKSAQSRNIDILIADTAGRLHNKLNLMEQLKKIIRVIKKLDESAPHEIMLVLDANTGQNSNKQVKFFQELITLSGLTITKLDGTAKGGVIFTIADQFGIPIRYVSIGENIEDLKIFNAKNFVESIFI